MTRARISLLIGAAVAIGTIVAAFTIMESPLERQQQRRDLQRFKDLQQLDERIRGYFMQEDRLPDSLMLLKEQYVDLHILDQYTDEPYGYEIIAPERFKLCARFSLERPDRNPQAHFRSRFRCDASVYWQHKSGYQCLELSAHYCLDDS